VYQATPPDPVVLVGVVLAMALLGLVATWILAQGAQIGESLGTFARGVKSAS